MNSPRHARLLHDCDCDSALERIILLPVIKHDKPPNCGKGLLQRRVRDCLPPLQNVVHEP